MNGREQVIQRLGDKRRLRDALVRHRELPMPALGEALMRELADYQGGQLRRDDLTVFGFRLN